LLESFSYLAVLALLVSAGAGAPVSEELILLTSGLLISRGTLNPVATLAVAWIGVLAGDSILYQAGNKLGRRALGHPRLKKILGGRLTGWIERHYARHGLLTVLLARQVAGMRAPAFLMAGISRLPFRRFIAADGAAAMVSVPLMLWLGYHFGTKLPQVLDVLRRGRWVVLGAATAAAITLLVRWWLRRSRRRAAGLVAAPGRPAEPGDPASGA
jgi:membrane protein DedA with SNARE-associated domain